MQIAVLVKKLSSVQIKNLYFTIFIEEFSQMDAKKSWFKGIPLLEFL